MHKRSSSSVKGHYRSETWVSEHYRRGTIVNEKSYSSHSQASPSPIYTYDSFVNPRAVCPKCLQKVFYYQSPYGGKVFFDTLGPPWPKHPYPCSDRNTQIQEQTERNQHLQGCSTAASNPIYPWQAEGWEPLCTISIHEVHSNKFISIRGIYKGNEISVYIKNETDFPKRSPLHLRVQDEESYELSTISITIPLGRIIKLRYRAYKTLQLAYIRTMRPTRRKDRYKRMKNKEKNMKLKVTRTKL